MLKVIKDIFYFFVYVVIIHIIANMLGIIKNKPVHICLVCLCNYSFLTSEKSGTFETCPGILESDHCFLWREEGIFNSFLYFVIVRLAMSNPLSFCKRSTKSSSERGFFLSSWLINCCILCCTETRDSVSSSLLFLILLVKKIL